MKEFQVAFLLGALVSLSNCQFHHTNYVPGRSVMVHLFEWKWNDIADECEQFLGPNGYAGVQVSPVSESVVMGDNAWWERYQPVSYEIDTRSGNKSEFESMVQRCNKVGVRIYVDAIINHMTAATGNVLGSTGKTYESDYTNATEVRVCQLSGLPDLNQTRSDVRSKIIGFMNELVELGVAGFRIDAAKHMWPSDLKVIYKNLNRLNCNAFPHNAKAFIYQEVTGGADDSIPKSEYTPLGVVTEFSFSHEVGSTFQGESPLINLRNLGPASGMVPSKDALVFVDNHDNQREGNSGILTFKTPQKYIMATAFMLAHPYGHPKVMSSYNFTSFDQGPPTDANGLISPMINATTSQCTNGWVCEHRWPAIRNMVHFRNVVSVGPPGPPGPPHEPHGPGHHGPGHHGPDSHEPRRPRPPHAPPAAPINSWWDNGSDQIAFGRSNRGFIAFNNNQTELNMKLDTLLPDGIYCDVITGELVEGKCSGANVTVENGQANINLSPDVGVQAIHIGSKVCQ